MNTVTKANQIGELITIDAASKAKGGTYPATYKWIKRNAIPLVRMGNMYLVRLSDLSSYQPR